MICAHEQAESEVDSEPSIVAEPWRRAPSAVPTDSKAAATKVTSLPTAAPAHWHYWSQMIANRMVTGHS